MYSNYHDNISTFLAKMRLISPNALSIADTLLCSHGPLASWDCKYLLRSLINFWSLQYRRKTTNKLFDQTVHQFVCFWMYCLFSLTRKINQIKSKKKKSLSALCLSPWLQYACISGRNAFCSLSKSGNI